MKELGKIIAKNRKANKMKQGELAKKLECYASHLDNKDVWKRANLDRKHFSKIQCDMNYHPKKKTVMALCIALELDLEQSKDLLDTVFRDTLQLNAMFRSLKSRLHIPLERNSQSAIAVRLSAPNGKVCSN